MKKYFQFVVWAKVATVVTVASTIFGVAFQKGMIEAMGLGGMSGNYQIEEIIKAAIYTYLMAGESILKVSTYKMLASNWYIVLLFGGMAYCAWWVSYSKDNVESIQDKVKRVAKDKLGGLVDSGVKSAIFGAVIGTFAWLLSAAMKFVFIIILVVPLFPVIVSHSLGKNYVVDLRERPVCGEVTEKMMEQDYLRQCSQLTIKGRKMSAKVVLERTDGRFYQTNEAFIFVSNDGDTCMYSGFYERKEGDEKEDVSFKSDQIQNFCIESFANPAEMTSV